MNRLRVLFVGESATLAHVARPYLLASKLDSARFEAHFACGPHFGLVHESSSIPIHRIYSRSPHEFERILRTNGVLFDENILSRYAADDLELLDRTKPDIVVGDLRLSLSVSAPVFGIPYVALNNAYWHPALIAGRLPLPYLPPLGLTAFSTGVNRAAEAVLRRLFRKILPKVMAAQAAGLDAVRKKYSLSPFPDYFSGFSHADVVAYSDIAELYPRSPLATTAHTFLGPVTWSPAVSLPGWWDAIPPASPVVYVALGSSGDERILQEIIRCAAAVSASFVVATGGRQVPTHVPTNVYLASYLPGELVAKRAALVLTNGGSPATYQALGQGAPVYGIPANMDQLLSMQTFETTGAVFCLRADSFSSRRFTTTVRALCEDSNARAAARRLGAVIQQYDPVDRLQTLLEDLAVGLKTRARGELAH